MNDKVISELFVVMLLAVLCLRVLFIKRVKVDSLTILAPFALFVSVLLFFCWGVRLPEVLLLVVSFIAFVFNLRAMLRLANGLFVDRYSVPFTIFSLLWTAIVVALGVAIFMLREVQISPANFGVTKEVYEYYGSLETGYTPRPDTTDKLFTKPQDACVNIYYKSTSTIAQDLARFTPVLLFCGDKRASLFDYEPFLIKLASKGYIVVAAQYETLSQRLLQRYQYIKRYFKQKNFTEVVKNEVAESCCLEYLYLIEIARGILQESHFARFYLVGDELNTIGMEQAQQSYNMQAQASLESTSSEEETQEEKIENPTLLGTIDISQFDSYIKGFGCIEQTDPWLCLLLKQKRDPTLYTAEHTAYCTQKFIQGIK